MRMMTTMMTIMMKKLVEQFENALVGLAAMAKHHLAIDTIVRPAKTEHWNLQPLVQVNGLLVPFQPLFCFSQC